MRRRPMPSPVRHALAAAAAVLATVASAAAQGAPPSALGCREAMIPARDGVRLHTTIVAPAGPHDGDASVRRAARRMPRPHWVSPRQRVQHGVDVGVGNVGVDPARGILLPHRFDLAGGTDAYQRRRAALAHVHHQPQHTHAVP